MIGASFLQATCCIYTGWFLVLGIAFFFPFAVWLRPGAWTELRGFYLVERGRIFRVLGVWGIAFGLFFLPYILANRGVSRGYAECGPFLPNYSTWVCGPEDSRWYRTIGPFRESVQGECALFCGPTLYLLLAAAGVWAWRTRKERGASPQWQLITASLLTVGALMIATMAYWESVSGWWFLRLLPGGGAIRVVARVYVAVYLFATIAAVLALTIWLSELKSTLARAGLYLMMAVIVFEQTGHTSDSFEKTEFYDRVETCAEAMRGAELAFLTGEFGSRGGIQPNLLGMWAGMRANVPVSNGYSGRSPDKYKDHELLTPEDLRIWLRPRFQGTIRFVDSRDPSKSWDVEIRGD